MLELFLAALLALPVDADDRPDEDDMQHLVKYNDPYFVGEIRDWGEEHELIDKNDIYLFRRNTTARDFLNQCRGLRQRYEKLKDAPLLWETKRFPNRDVLAQLISFNQAYRNQMEAKRNMAVCWKVPWYDQVLRESLELYKIYDNIRDAQFDGYGILYRRECLKHLREAIGDDNFYNSILPPPVPLWRFEKVP
jgi:hypothetical protein